MSFKVIVTYKHILKGHIHTSVISWCDAVDTLMQSKLWKVLEVRGSEFKKYSGGGSRACWVIYSAFVLVPCINLLYNSTSYTPPPPMAQPDTVRIPPQLQRPYPSLTMFPVCTYCFAHLTGTVTIWTCSAWRTTLIYGAFPTLVRGHHLIPLWLSADFLSN